MVLEQLPDLLSAVVSDGLTSDQSAMADIAGFTASAMLRRLLAGRNERARAILLEELRAGETSLPPTQIDEGWRSSTAICGPLRRGAARVNLRLMAKVIAGQALLGNLSADEFLHDADMIGSLRYEEIVLLATVHRIWKDDHDRPQTADLRANTAFTQACTKVVPTVFRAEEDCWATAATLVRTGLVTTTSGWGTVGYAPTAKLNRLVELASFEAVLRRERRT